jgi:hypothetical protein
MGRGEKMLLLLLLLPLATKHWNLARATKHWNLPLVIELGPSFTSFLFLLFKKANLDHWGFFSLPDIIFDLNLENTYSYNLFWEEKNDYS